MQRPFSLRRLAGPAVALLVFGGCDPERDPGRDAVEWRTDEFFDISAGLDPIPGGGACEECVTDAVLTNIGSDAWRLDLCINGQITYVGRTLRKADDIPLGDLLTTLTTPHDDDWHLVGGPDGAPLCNSPDSGACKFADLKLGEGSVELSIEFTSSGDEPAPGLLRFVPPDALLGAGPTSPAMRIRPRPPGVPLQCAEPVIQSSPAALHQIAKSSEAPALAHITSSVAHGGIRSCSGVLIAPDHVLTAAHCLPPTGTSWQEAGTEPAIVQVRLLAASGSLDSTFFGVESVLRHPDAPRDLALVRLDRLADLTKFKPVAYAGPQPGKAGGCTLQGRGFGRSDSSQGFDWGHVKSVPVRQLDPQAPVHADFSPGDLGKLILLENLKAGTPELCRGDSGGPIIQECGGQRRIVGVAFARVFESDTSTRVDGTGIERLTNAFAFSRGNTCGEGELVAYVASRVDQDVQAWIAGIIGGSSPPQPAPVYE